MFKWKLILLLLRSTYTPGETTIEPLKVQVKTISPDENKLGASQF